MYRSFFKSNSEYSIKIRCFEEVTNKNKLIIIIIIIRFVKRQNVKRLPWRVGSFVWPTV